MRTGVVLHDLPTAQTDLKARPSVRGADMMTDLPGESTRTDVVLHDLPTIRTDLKARLSVRGTDTTTGLPGESTRTDVVLHDRATERTEARRQVKEGLHRVALRRAIGIRMKHALPGRRRGRAQ